MDTSAIESDSDNEEMLKKRKIQKPNRLIADDNSNDNHSSDRSDSPPPKSPIALTGTSVPRHAMSSGNKTVLSSAADLRPSASPANLLTSGRRGTRIESSSTEAQTTYTNSFSDGAITRTVATGSAGPSILTSTSGIQALYYYKLFINIIIIYILFINYK